MNPVTDSDPDELVDVLEDAGLSPAEAKVFVEREVRGHGRQQTADALDKSPSTVDSQLSRARRKIDSMEQALEQIDDEADDRIETIAVPIDELLEAFQYQAQPPKYRGRTDAVLRLSPPFEATAEASAYYVEQGNHYPPEMDPKPIHIDPWKFVDDDLRAYPTRQQQEIYLSEDVKADRLDLVDANSLEDLDDEREDELIDERLETAREVWRSDWERDRPDEIRISHEHVNDPVQVVYE